MYPKLILRCARENSRWGYDRIAGALANLGYHVSDQTVANVLRRHGLEPVPERERKRFLRRVIREYLDHYHAERNHQGVDIGNRLLFPITVSRIARKARW